MSAAQRTLHLRQKKIIRSGIPGTRGSERVVKYDRPVWQIMHKCADAMPEVFRYDDVRTWFAEHYPDVNEATIRAHLIGLTEGGRSKHVQFAARSPIFRRVARGEYAPIPAAERGEDPDAPPSPTSQLKMSGNGHHQASAEVPAQAEDDEEDLEQLVPDIILLGSVGERVNVPAPAKEVFRDTEFQLSRLEAEVSGSEWFILSAEHGLVAPNEWMSPDSRTLADMDPEYRLVWASWVVTRLQSLVGSLDGMLVRVDAPNPFIGPLFAGLQDAGAVVSSGSISSGEPPYREIVIEVPHRYQHVEDASVRPLSVEEVHEPLELQDEPEDVQDEPVEVQEIEPIEVHQEIATVTDIDVGSPAVAHLLDSSRAISAADVSSLPRAPGVYGWHVDPVGARVLNRCLRLPVAPGLVFVGQVGGSTAYSLVDPVLNLHDHIDRVQLHGRTRASTFRMTLATVLGAHLGMTSLEDRRLTEWMVEHLSVTTWEAPDGSGLRELAQVVISELDPPLNVDRLPATEYRARLQQMRGALA